MDSRKNWGNRPWRVDVCPQKRVLPEAVDFAVIGGGFSGLAAAIQLKSIDPAKSVALLEAETIGSGASGYTGGVALAETAAGDLPGLGDVLAGYQRFIQDYKLQTELHLPGCYELSRSHAIPNSPISWNDSGRLCASKEVPGGTIDPGKTVSELTGVAENSGVFILEKHPVTDVTFSRPIELRTPAGSLRAEKILFATNAFALEISGIQGHAAFTTAVLTEPLSDDMLDAVGLANRKPFYTVDLPYLWGRLLGDSIIFGSGLIFFEDWRELHTFDITSGNAPETFARLEKRVHALHPALAHVQITHQWGGPICISDDWRPCFRYHPQSEKCIVLGGYSGHGVALSVYLGIWAAEAMMGARRLPDWS